MNYFLAKTEPGEYSIDDLKKDDEAIWDGVTNPAACKNIRSMKVGDCILIYHSGKDPAVVGLAKVIKEAFQDPKNPRSWVPEFKFLKKFTTTVSLAEIKESHKFDDLPLVRQGRLSTMIVPAEFITWLKQKSLDIP